MKGTEITELKAFAPRALSEPAVSQHHTVKSVSTAPGTLTAVDELTPEPGQIDGPPVMWCSAKRHGGDPLPTDRCPYATEPA
jgi:hypothetical protein